jgi:hypothetical protein
MGRKIPFVKEFQILGFGIIQNFECPSACATVNCKLCNLAIALYWRQLKNL